MSPPNGVSSSRIRKIAPEIDNAQTSIVAMTVALADAKIPSKEVFAEASSRLTTSADIVAMSPIPSLTMSFESVLR